VKEDEMREIEKMIEESFVTPFLEEDHDFV
jgi:hypothetical protein